MKTLTVLMILLPASVFMSAQNTYYYYQGNKIPLSEDNSRIVSISSKTENASLPSLNGVSVVNTICDTRSNITVYETSDADFRRIAKSSSFPSSMYIQPCYKSESGNELIPNGYLNIKLRKSSDFPILQNIATQKGCEIIEQNTFMSLWYNLRVIETPGSNSVSIANSIYETGKFAACFPSFSFNAREISYDPDVKKQWGLYNSNYESFDINISKAWCYATGRGINIAFVDEGIDLHHLDLIDNLYPLSYDATTRTSPSRLYGSHGTHCAGIAAAVRNNGIGTAGVAPESKIISVSVNLGSIANIESDLANGINWAWQNGADIISCSWWCIENDLVKQAIDEAVINGRDGKGCVIIKSAGNKNSSITFPGNLSNVIAVANMKKNGLRKENSCFGDNMFVCAPGDSIWSTVPDYRTMEEISQGNFSASFLSDDFAYMGGTSMAAPHVAGVVALILERNPSLTVDGVREIIANNTIQVGDKPWIKKGSLDWNKWYGYGLIDAYEAVKNTPRNQ